MSRRWDGVAMTRIDAHLAELRSAVADADLEAVTRRPPGCATCWPSLVEPAERIGDVASARMATCASW